MEAKQYNKKWNGDTQTHTIYIYIYIYIYRERERERERDDYYYYYLRCIIICTYVYSNLKSHFGLSIPHI